VTISGEEALYLDGLTLVRTWYGFDPSYEILPTLRYLSICADFAEEERAAELELDEDRREATRAQRI
jgi:hypothetical protein